jgi:hypothetical protein
MDRPTVRRLLTLIIVVGAAAVAQAASASQMISTSSAAGIGLSVNGKGEALLTYSTGGKVVHVLAWGAVNALPPARGGKQVAFELDYSGGFDKYYNRDMSVQRLRAKYNAIKNTPGYLVSPVVRRLQQASQFASNYWKTGFHGSCGRYDGPPVTWLVTACKAPDGSYWAVQSWQRMLPNYGVQATAAQSAWEVHLAHWTGPLPVLALDSDWAWHRWDHLYGTFTYDGAPVYGFSSTSSGVPLDSFGRNLYLDTYDSAYGKGWLRENSFLTHTNTGVFCYSFNPHGAHPAGNGTKYRATIIGPGVTPDVTWQGLPPGPYNPAADAQANTKIAALHDRVCRPN